MSYKIRIPLLIIIWIICMLIAAFGVAVFSMQRSLDSSKSAIHDALLQANEKYPRLVRDEQVLKRDYYQEKLSMGSAIRLIRQEQELSSDDAVPSSEAVPSSAQLKSYARMLDASYVAVTDTDGNILAHTGKRENTDGRIHTVEEPDDPDNIMSSSSLDPETTAVYETDLDDGLRLRYEISCADLNMILADVFSWQTVLRKMTLPDKISYIVISKEDGIILSHPGEDLVGKDLKHLGFASEEALLNEFSAPDKDGIRWHISPSLNLNADSDLDIPSSTYSGMVEDKNVWLICLLPCSNLLFYVIQSFQSLPLLFAAGSLLVLLYILFHFLDIRLESRKQKTDRGETRADENRAERAGFGKTDAGRTGSLLSRVHDLHWKRKLIICSIIVLICTGVIALHLQLLSNASQKNADLAQSKQLKRVAQENNRNAREQMDEWYKARGLKLAAFASDAIEGTKTFRERSGMKELTDTMGLSGIYLFSQNGKVRTTSTPFDHLDLHDAAESPMSRTFLPLLDGVPENAWTPITDQDENTHDMYAGVSIRNERDLCDGCTGIVKTLPDVLISADGSYNIYSHVLTLASGNADSRIPLSTAQIRNVLFLMAILALCLFLMGLAGTVRNPSRSHSGGPDARGETDPAGGPDAENTLPDAGRPASSSDRSFWKEDFESWFFNMGNGEKDETFFERWNWDTTPLLLKSAEKKLVLLLKVLLFLAAIMTLYLYATKSNDVDISITKNLFDGTWARGLNIYSVTAVELVVIVSVAAAMLLRRLVFALAYFCSARGETVCHLVNSLISYVAIFLAAFYSLMLFGIDVKMLMASAGVLGIVIGFGAQSMIADILSGFFLIFEDIIHVGDFIIMGESSGVVMNVGVRMTKIQYFGTIISINNGELKQFSNLSAADARVSCVIPVDLSENLYRAEAVIERELPGITERLSETGYSTSEILYRGVSGFDGTGYSLRFDVKCISYRYGRVLRFLNGELIKMCNRNNIQLARQHVMLSDPETESGPETGISNE